MTLHQIEALAIVAGMLVLFVSDRLRYDLVAALALSAAVLLGVVPASKAFAGFSSSVVIIIASVLVISRAVAISGVIDNAMRRLLRVLEFHHAAGWRADRRGHFHVRIREECRRAWRVHAGGDPGGRTAQSTGLALPDAAGVRLADRRHDHPDRHVAQYPDLGGAPGDHWASRITCSTSPRSACRCRCLAIVFLSFGWRLLPANRRGQPSPEKRFAIEDYTSEAALPENSPLVGKTVADLEALGDGEVTVAGIIREHSHRYVPRPHWTLYANDILVLQGDPTALQPMVDQAKLKLLGAEEIAELKPRDKDDDLLETTEAVIAPDSLLIGRTPQDLHLRQTYEVNLLALSRGGQQTTTRLQHSRFEAGDIVVLQGRQSQLARAETELRLLPLAERNLAIGRPRRRYLPLLILSAAMIAIATGAVQVEVGFFVAATLIVLLRQITPREAYDAVDWPIIVMLGCLIPVGEALKDTGAAKLLADGLTVIAAHCPGYGAVGLILVVSMLVTPMLHHAAAVLVMGPIAAAVAKNLGLGPDAFLMAVAFGAASTS